LSRIYELVRQIWKEWKEEWRMEINNNSSYIQKRR
jgi:hypothetical protein